MTARNTKRGNAEYKNKKKEENQSMWQQKVMDFKILFCFTFGTGK